MTLFPPNAMNMLFQREQPEYGADLGLTSGGALEFTFHSNVWEYLKTNEYYGFSHKSLLKEN